MPRLYPDRQHRRAPALICLIALLGLPHGHAAQAPASPVVVNYEGVSFTRDDRSALLDRVVITQVEGTLIRASKAEGSKLANGFDSGHWVLTGKVHIEYEDFVLDADAATVVFANRFIQSIQVHGEPARFSRPGKIAGQPYKGTAQKIGFDGAKRQVRFTGHSWFSYGPSEGNSDKPLVFDLDSASLSSEDDGSSSTINMTIQGRLQVQCSRLRAVRGDGTMLLEELVMTQGPGTLVTAGKAEGSQLSEGTDNSHWRFADQVHVEYDRFAMDASTATVEFANQLIKWIEVRGQPARFSHPGKVAGWPASSTADAITFDGLKKQVRFPDYSRFSYGPHRGESQLPLVYELDTGVFRSEKGNNPDASINMKFDRDEQGRIAPSQKPRSKSQ
jgi:lipopolysaccharide export system protein LptA